MLSLTAEQLFDRGESLWLIDVEGGQVMLTPAASWTIYSGNVYELELPEPNQIRTRFVSGDAVIHLRISHVDTHSLGRSLTRRRSVGQPTVDDSTKKLQEDIKRLGGRTVVVPSMAGNWDQGPAAAARPVRLATATAGR